MYLAKGKSIKTPRKTYFEEEHFVNLSIKFIDTGVGISENGLKNLFVNFGKLTENASMNKQGTGLGLSICKNIIE